MKETLIYVMDPICGWSFGNSANILAIYNDFKDEYEFEIISGGIKIANETESGSADMYAYTKHRAGQIAKLTERHISDTFFNQIAINPAYVFDSTPPSRAIAAMKLINNTQAIIYAHYLQDAYFINGQNISDIEVASAVAMLVGVDKATFISAYKSPEAEALVQADYDKARAMKVDSFPSLYLSSKGNLMQLAKGLMPEQSIRQSLSFCFKPL